MIEVSMVLGGCIGGMGMLLFILLGRTVDLAERVALLEEKLKQRDDPAAIDFRKVGK